MLAHTHTHAHACTRTHTHSLTHANTHTHMPSPSFQFPTCNLQLANNSGRGHIQTFQVFLGFHARIQWILSALPVGSMSGEAGQFFVKYVPAGLSSQHSKPSHMLLQYTPSVGVKDHYWFSTSSTAVGRS